MKKNKNLFVILLLIIFCNCLYAFKINTHTISKGEFCIEVNTGKILHAHNENKPLPIASITKILTCITALENCDVNKEIIVNNKTCGVEGSSIYLKEGEKYQIKSLLYGLMLRSGNDAAETIAQNVLGRENFIVQMNNLAKKCGAINSNFTNPHGLHEKNHYSTAYDIGKITCYALKNSIFKEIVSTKVAKVKELSNNCDKIFYNKNKMLNLIDGAIGVKTGYTKVAGRCLVSACERNGKIIVCVVINSPQMYERSCELIEESFKKFSYDPYFKD